MLAALSETLLSTTAPQPREAPWGLYVHIPFCRRVCPYCDFNVYARQEPLIPAYLAALARELELIAARWGRGPLQTIYLGGGTPSLLEPGQIAAVLEAIARTFDVLPGAEVSLEANPETVERSKLTGYRSAGVNRLSIGVQTLAPHGLKVLGRAHRPEMPERAFRAARDAGFENVNLDLIYGWPGQTREDWLRDLTTVLSWEPEHLSLYALTIEPGTPYARGVQRGVLRPLDDDALAELAELAMELLAQHGYEHYEVSNWARERFFRSRHNQIYWRNGWYIGAGAGAHGYLGGLRTVNERLPTRYIERIGAGELPIREEEPIDPRTEAIETMILGIRLVTDGVSARSFRERHGRDLLELYRIPIMELQGLGLVEWDGERLRLTRRGILVANEVAVRFLEPLW